MNYAISDFLKPQFTIHGGHVRITPALEHPHRPGIHYVGKVTSDAFLCYLQTIQPIYSLYIYSTPLSTYAFTNKQFQYIKDICHRLNIIFVADILLYTKPNIRFNDIVYITYI